jgi:hypothetical protein
MAEKLKQFAGQDLPMVVMIVVLAATCASLVLLGSLQTAPEVQPSAARPSAIVPIKKPIKKAKPAPPVLFTFPNGKRQLLPDYRFVALYGTPGASVLGVLGEQDIAASIARAKALAADYQPLSTETIYPTFEIITTVASATPTENGDYSREIDASQLLPWIEAARDNGVYVVLDLQSGRTDFLTQAKLYEQLLTQPNVGLALDPEWRLSPSELPIRDIGEVSVDEVNATSAWLSDLTAAHNLPQKLLVLHQFRLDMLPNRDRLNMSHANLAYVLQMDGQGSQQVKQDTWRTITQGLPPGLEPGWKNFYRKDTPVLDPAGTMAITPAPRYISYQ